MMDRCRKRALKNGNAPGSDNNRHKRRLPGKTPRRKMFQRAMADRDKIACRRQTVRHNNRKATVAGIMARAVDIAVADGRMTQRREDASLLFF